MRWYRFTTAFTLSTALLAGLAVADDWEQISGQGMEGDGGGVATELAPTSEVESAETMAAHPNVKLYEDAQAERRAWLKATRERLVALRIALTNGSNVDADALLAVRSWWHLGDQNPTGPDLDTAINLIDKNSSQLSWVTVYPAAVTVHCDRDPSPDTGVGGGFACAQTSGNLIYLRQRWTTSGSVCRSSVLTHEYFHNVGLDDYTGYCGEKRPMADILNNADCMAGLVCALGGGGGCGKPC